MWPLEWDLAPGAAMALHVAFNPAGPDARAVRGPHEEELVLVCDNCQVSSRLATRGSACDRVV